MKLFINVPLVERMLGRKVAWEKTGWTEEERGGMRITTFHFLDEHRRAVHTTAAQGPPRPEPGKPKSPPHIGSVGAPSGLPVGVSR